MAIYFTLSKILEERNMTELQLAKKTGIREGTLYDICNNKIKRLPVKAIELISNELQIEPGDWIKNDGPQQTDSPSKGDM